MTGLPAIAAASLLVLAACVDTPLPRAAAPRPEMAPLARPPGWIDVELVSSREPVPLDCSGTCTLLGPDGRPLAERLRLSSAGARAAPKAVILDGETYAPVPLEIVPEAGAVLSVGGRAYRGRLRLDPGRTGLRLSVVNRLPVEDYLLGVLPGEMPERFGLEALKAQAVAARSYALAESASRGRLHADQRSQVYGGRDAETALASRAVRETQGQVLAHDGEPITSFYHSTCGGRGVSDESVFGSATPGLLDAAVECPDCQDSPWYSWTRRFPSSAVCAAAGLAPPLTAVDATDPLPGRPALVRVRAAGGEATLPATTLREKLSAGRPLAEQLPATFWTRLSLDGDALVVDGHGWGHGVGLCQYGAAGFAARGGGYQAILRRYYPGADLCELPAPALP